MEYKCQLCQCSSQPLIFELGHFDRDERLDFVESVLEVLNDSRFGPERPFPLLTRFRNPPELGTQVFFVMTPVGILPAIEMEIYPRRFMDPIQRAIVGNHMQALKDRCQNPEIDEMIDQAFSDAACRIPSNYSRGSPSDTIVFPWLDLIVLDL